jgi:small conductance mechanosensitive channel
MAAPPTPLLGPQDPFSPQALWLRYGDEVITLAINLTAAIAILLLGLWLAGRIAKAVRRLALKSDRVDETLAGFLAQLTRYAITGFVILAVLQRFGVETTSIVAVIGAATLAIGLALQGTLSNVAAGVMLILFRPYRLGDFVEVAGASGLIEDVGLFTSTLKTLDGVVVTLPNGLCWGAPIRNFSTNPERRGELVIGVAYDTNLDHAIGIMHRVIASDPRVLQTPAPVVRVVKLGDFAVDIAGYFWTANSAWFLTRLDLLKATKEAFDAAGVAIPFPTTYNYEVRLPDQAAAKPPSEALPDKEKPSTFLGDADGK